MAAPSTTKTATAESAAEIDVTDDATERVLASSPQLGEDEFVQILWHCGFLRQQLLRVCKSFRRLWLSPATWVGAHVTMPFLELSAHPESGIRYSAFFFCEKWLPALSRVAALDTTSLMLDLLRRSDRYDGPDGAALWPLLRVLSKLRLSLMPSVNSGLPPCCGWFRPPSGYYGVSENMTTNGQIARRLDTTLAGMAAVCGNGPVPRDASGSRSFTLKIEAVDSNKVSGVYVGFVATPPADIDFINARQLWSSATMWRFLDTSFSSNVSFHSGHHLSKSDDLDSPSEWSTEQLNVGDELRITARVAPAGVETTHDDSLVLEAHLNGVQVVRPMLMRSSAFALELWPYVAVCGRVTAVRLMM